ncbi:hypothetical protein F4809DRAFT_660792 [Biscogniauxia mediterranea]|nr:hypothetical protein F4809DRAFT_660792 [Biscogniauxia mediterranea]
MSVITARPVQTTPLIAFSTHTGYATIKPKLSLTIPKTESPKPVPVSTRTDFVLDIDQMTYVPNSTDMTTTTCTHSRDGSMYCDYCFQNDLQHNLEDDHRVLWKKCLETEGVMAVLEFLIVLQMRLLVIAVFLLLALIIIFTEQRFHVYLLGTKILSSETSKSRPIPHLRNDTDAAVATTVTDHHEFAWNTCSGSHEQERIVVKEKALQDGLKHYERIVDTLQRFQSMPNLDAQHAESICSHDQRQKWIQSCEELKKRHNDFAVLVGVAGKTGSGKTSALNALLGYRELLPTSNDSAATSVVCKVSYNHDDRLEYAFRACVIFRQKTDFLEQLEQFFEDLKGRNELEAAHNSSIEDEDALRIANATLKTNLEMINAVFGLEESDVEHMSAQELISSNPDIDALIGTQKWFHGNKADILSEKIKPYMDSTSMAHATSGMEFAAWPLIDEVQIFVKSDILKNGVVLVDLPGTGDSVESRAAVAERYYTKLAATMIITPISRAADESTSVKLMSHHQEMSMKLDGKFHKKNYCVVLSHIDQIDRAAALRKPEAKSNQELQGYIQRERELRAEKSARDEEAPQLIQG